MVRWSSGANCEARTGNILVFCPYSPGWGELLLIHSNSYLWYLGKEITSIFRKLFINQLHCCLPSVLSHIINFNCFIVVLLNQKCCSGAAKRWKMLFALNTLQSVHCFFLQVIFVGTESWCDGRKYFPINQFAVNFLGRISHDGVHFVRVYWSNAML